MMNKKTAAFMAILCVAFLTAACGKKDPQTVTLKLPANPTTGYEWQVEQDPELFEISSEYKEDEHPEGMVGVGGTQTFVLTPKEAGTTVVTFSYLQPWEESSLDTRINYTMKIDKNMQVQNTSTTAQMGGSMDEVPTVPEMVIE